MHKRTFPTLNHVWLFTAVALIALRPLVIPIPPHDFWWHMAMGRFIVQNGFIPSQDIFSYTQAGTPFYNQGWLAQVLMYGIHGLGGVPLVLIVQSAVVVLAYALLLWLCIRRSGALRLSVALLLVMLPLSFDNWNVRPQTYTLPIFVAFLVILTQWRSMGTGDRQQGADPAALGSLWAGRLWLLPLLMVLWVNLHGSFVLGGALMALTFVGVWGQRLIADWRAKSRGTGEPGQEQLARPPLRVLFIWGVVTAAAMLINPRGIGVIGYVFNLLGTSTVTNLVQEWAAPTVRDLTGRIFFLFLMLLIAVLAYARRRPDPIDMWLAAPFLWLALGAERNIIWFAILVTPLLVVQVASWLPTPQKPVSRLKAEGVPLLNGILMGMIALLLLPGLPWVKPALALPPEIGSLIDPATPVQATRQLRADPQPPQRLFHPMSYGSYLMWAAPEHPVFIDTRIELYPLEQWQDYINLNAGINAPALLSKYQIDGLLLNNEEQAALLEFARADPSWSMRYEDEYSSYLVRSQVSRAPAGGDPLASGP